MKIRFNKWNKELEFDSKKPTVIYFNDVQSLFDFSTNLCKCINEEFDDIVFIDGDIEMNLEKDIEYIQDVFNLNYNSKKIISFLIKKITKEVNTTGLQISFDEQKKNINEFLNNIKDNTLIEFDFDDGYEVDDLLKMVKIKSIVDYDNINLYINKYIEIIKESTKVKVIVLKFVFEYFETEAILELIKYIENENLSIIFVEKTQFINKINESLYQKFFVDQNFVL